MSTLAYIWPTLALSCIVSGATAVAIFYREGWLDPEQENSWT